jgi:hypothetical protein
MHIFFSKKLKLEKSYIFLILRIKDSSELGLQTHFLLFFLLFSLLAAVTSSMVCLPYEPIWPLRLVGANITGSPPPTLI